MTPGGHAGASIVVAYIVECYVFRSEPAPVTLGLSALVGLLPDVDSLIALVIDRRQFLRQKLRHHLFPTHTPLFYVILTSMLWLVGPPRVAALFGMISIGHLVMDSWATDDGIMWLWPLSRRQYSLFPRDLHAGDVFGLRFYRKHVRCWRAMLPEVLLLLSGSLLALSALTLST